MYKVRTAAGQATLSSSYYLGNVQALHWQSKLVPPVL